MALVLIYNSSGCYKLSLIYITYTKDSSNHTIYFTYLVCLDIMWAQPVARYTSKRYSPPSSRSTELVLSGVIVLTASVVRSFSCCIDRIYWAWAMFFLRSPEMKNLVELSLAHARGPARLSILKDDKTSLKEKKNRNSWACLTSRIHCLWRHP